MKYKLVSDSHAGDTSNKVQVCGACGARKKSDDESGWKWGWETKRGQPTGQMFGGYIVYSEDPTLYYCPLCAERT